MENKESLIGKLYVPRDNSYSRNLSNERTKESLAGNVWSEAYITTIKSEPFLVNTCFLNKVKSHLFILVETERQETYFVMYYEHGVVSETNTLEDIRRFDVRLGLDLLNMNP